MILLLDNLDSFVHNLERYFVRLGHPTSVVRVRDTSAEQIRAVAPDAIIFSPGPGEPNENCPAVYIVREFWESIPILGVCLGHQQIVFALGGRVERADQPVHGRASAIHHDGNRELANLPNPFVAARYHSLVTTNGVTDALEVSAHTEDGTVMAVRALERPVFGWQFHPESILTPTGFDLLRGFLRESGLPASDQPLGSERADHSAANDEGPRHPTHPVTF